MLERLKNSFDKGVAAVSVKSESIVESSRVRMAINTAQKSMDESIANLGKTFYTSWSNGSLNVDELKSECERIQAISTEIENLNARLEKIKEEEKQILGVQKKNEGGKPVFCVECGKKLDAGARFCDECGTPVKQ